MDYKEEVSNRLRLIINEFAGGNNSKFGRIIGFPENVIRSYIRNNKEKSMPSAEFIAKIVEKTNCSADWILLGIGEMEKKPQVKITDANEYLTLRFEETIRSNERKDLKIKELENEISVLKAEKKKNYPLLVVAEPDVELEKKTISDQ